MSDDSVAIKTPIVSVGIRKKEQEIIIKEGDTIIIREWNWRKFRSIKKAVTKTDGKIFVQVI
jgi:hypothetical protein